MSDPHSTPVAGAVAPLMSPELSAPAPGLRRELRAIGFLAPFHWLRLGWGDMMAAPVIGLFYGACFWLMALTLGAVFRNAPEYAMSVVSGCFIAGPFLAMGLYESSRRRELGLAQDFGASLTCWDRRLSSMGTLVLVLVLLELLWGRASLVVFALFFNTGMPSTSSVMDAVFNPANWEFVAVYLVVGGVFAGLAFSTCVVSIPMILDRDTDAISAGVASMEVVATRTGPMLLWGGLIVALVGGALWLPWSLALVVVGPWIGHASWQAYRGSLAWVPDTEAVSQP